MNCGAEGAPSRPEESSTGWNPQRCPLPTGDGTAGSQPLPDPSGERMADVADQVHEDASSRKRGAT